MTRAILFSIFLFTAILGAPEPMPTPHRAPDKPSELMTVLRATLVAARQFHVDPVLALSMAFHESSFRPNCVTWHWRKLEDGTKIKIVTGRGLFQHNPRYQDENVVRFLGWHPSQFDWRNPEHSATLGCAMMAHFVKKYGTFGALACFNCGEGRYRQLRYGVRLPLETIEYQRRIL